MQSALHITTKVLPGNRIEVQLPDSSEGQELELFIVLPVTTEALPDKATAIVQMAEDPDIQAELAVIQSTEALARIRSRPRINPIDFGLPGSTDLIRDYRNR